jgi:hypothetical protein
LNSCFILALNSPARRGIDKFNRAMRTAILYTKAIAATIGLAVTFANALPSLGAFSVMLGVLLAEWLLMIAFSLGHGQEAGRLKCEDTTKLKRDDPIRQRLANTVRLPGPCSGSLVIFEGRTASEKALVLSAGHCTLRALGPGQVLKNLKQERALAINTLKFEARKACAATSVLLYATMT